LDHILPQFIAQLRVILIVFKKTFESWHFDFAQIFAPLLDFREEFVCLSTILIQNLLSNYNRDHLAYQFTELFIPQSNRASQFD